MNQLKTVALSAFMLATVACTTTLAQRNNRDQGKNQPQNERSSRGDSRKTQSKSQKPQWGATVQTPPKRTTTVKSPDNNYHYREGVYYRKDNTGNYHVGPAPAGARIKSLPTGYSRVLLNGAVFFYYYGTFYRNIDRVGYEVVTPPVGAVVYSLPDGYSKIVIEGITYYTFDGVYFKAFVDDRGEVAYEVVGDIRR